MKNITILLMIIIAFVVKGSAQTIPEGLSVTSAEIREWISYLASDEMKGRANGSAEMNTAANWIVEKFRKNNLKPIFSNGEYIQNYTATARQRTFNERNVIGILPGTDPLLKDQYIVLSAHYDHIGIRQGVTGDLICNGADDNAAGVSTLIGIASKMMRSGQKPGRTIIFAAFSGEEMGMRGARYFVANSPVPVKNISADINFEMIGHSELLGKNRYYMTGCSLSNLDDIISENNIKTGFTLVDTIAMASSLFYGSDNIAFSMLRRAEGMTTGIPSGTFATSTMAPYLHTPRDEATLFDFENMAGLVNHFADMVFYLSNYKGDIKWTDPGFKRPE
jgi:hypothetical protein